MSMGRRWKWVAIAPALLVAFLVFVAAGGEVVRRLWNWLMPAIFGWNEITFWQALGLLVLCRVLFGGHSFGSRPHHRSREERERFRQRMRERFGMGPAPTESGGQ